MPRKTIKMLEERLLAQQRIELEGLRSKDKQIGELKNQLAERSVAQVGQIMQSMATMMESAARVVLSLHRNI